MMSNYQGGYEREVLIVDPISGLVQIGLTEYEARAYLALLRQPDISGYEVSRLSGVPRSKVYEALEGLVRKGAATIATHNGKQSYLPLPHELLLARHERSTAKVVADLSSSLGQLSAQQADSAISTLSGYNSVIERVRELCRSASVRLLVAGWPVDLEQIAPELTGAEERGVKVFALSYGPCNIHLKNLIVHTTSPLQYLQVTVIGRWLGVVADYEESMLVIAGAETLGIWGSNKGLVYALSLWIQHDIQAMEFIRYLGNEELSKVPAEVQQRLQEMTLIQPEEMRLAKKRVIPQDIPAIRLIGEMVARIAANPLVYGKAHGEYGLELRGEDGGVFTVVIDSSGATLREGLVAPGLVVSMETQDFVALVRGTLPLMAFMERGRLSVSGDLGLASNLQLILRG